MSETPRAPEINYDAPVSIADMPMLAVFGVALPDTDNETWLEELNRKVAIGSRNLLNCDLEAVTEIVTSRIAVINELTALKPGTRSYLSKAYNNATPAQSNSMFAAMRALYHNKYGVDALKVVDDNTTVLLRDPKSIDERLDGLDGLGLVPRKVAIAALTYPTITVAKKLDDLTELGLPATHIINDWPGLVRIDKARIQERLDNFTDLGLDALKVATAAPAILKYLPGSFRTKFLLLETAFRYWGVTDPRARAIALAQESPSQFSNSPHRVRTLIRLGSAVLPSSVVDSLEFGAIALLVQNIKTTLGGYLGYQYGSAADHPQLATVAEFCAFSRRQYRVLGAAGLKELMAQHADDPIIQFHNKRGLPMTT